MLHYKIEGKGDPVVFLHGYLENSKMWDEIIPAFADSYQVIAIDLPGHGKSDNFQDIHNIEFVARKVIEVFEEESLTNALVIGHSMGGYVALALLEEHAHKLSGIVLLNSTSKADSEEKKNTRLKAVKTAEENLEKLIDLSIPNLFAEKNIDVLKSEVEKAKIIAKETSLHGVQAALKGMAGRKDRTFVLEETALPVLIINGLLDNAVNAKEFRNVIPGNENIRIEELDCGHMAHAELKQETINLLDGFVKDVFS